MKEIWSIIPSALLLAGSLLLLAGSLLAGSLLAGSLLVGSLLAGSLLDGSREPAQQIDVADYWSTGQWEMMPKHCPLQK